MREGLIAIAFLASLGASIYTVRRWPGESPGYQVVLMTFILMVVFLVALSPVKP